MKTVALVTASISRDFDGDLPRAVQAARRVGLRATVVDWDDASVDWGGFDGAVIRSTWDYTERRDEFLSWAVRVERATRLANPAVVAEWNSSKRYLADLAAAGVPVVPTAWINDGGEIPEEWEDVVVKPAVSAGGRSTGRYRRARPDAMAFASRLRTQGHDVLAQPYVESVDRQGEIGVYFFGGEPSHAVRKGAILHAGRPPAEDYKLAIGQSVDAVALDDAPVMFAREVLGAVPNAADLLYARVDCVRGADGEHLILEVELIEPALFLATDDGAAARFASAVAAWI